MTISEALASSPTLKETLAERWLPMETKRNLGLLIMVPAYVQDPWVGKDNPDVAIEELEVDWEPGLRDGPTSARIAVVDYDGTTHRLCDKIARWDRKKWRFINEHGTVLGSEDSDSPEFHQAAVWAIVQRVLASFEDSTALGRRLPWGFEGNRLIVVPHAGYGENACYDRQSKSLQFYYCGPSDNRIQTCLSHDIVAHEAGHAVLDGVRPYYNSMTSLETSAFHEFVADLTALLSSLQNNDVRAALAKALKSSITQNLSGVHFLTNVGEQFGLYINNRPFIRTAKNEHKMTDLSLDCSPHFCSQVLTGAMFDIAVRLEEVYEERGRSDKQVLWDLIQRLQRVALQPLDFCPPVDIQFEDYVHAVLSRDRLANPHDPHDYRVIMRDVFSNRGICCPTEENLQEFEDSHRLRHYDIDQLAGSKTAAYHFLHQHRKMLAIPENQDFHLPDPYVCSKVRRAYRRLPRELVLQYVWEEEIQLEGERFQQYEGSIIGLLCGGTLVFDERGNLVYLSRKPGCALDATRTKGMERRQHFLDYIESLIAQDAVAASGTVVDVFSRQIAVSLLVDGKLRLEARPRIHNIDWT